MAPVTPKTPKTRQTPSRVRLSLEQKIKLTEEASKPGFNVHKAVISQD